MPGTKPPGGQPPPTDDSRIGTMINNHRIVRRIGSGGMGTVYEAINVEVRRRCAIKILHPELSTNPQATARFLREALVANLPQHPGIVAVHEAGAARDGSIFILMEYLDGESLSRRIGRTFGAPYDSGEQTPSCVASGALPGSLPGVLASDVPPSFEYIESALRLGRQLASTLDAVHKSGVIHRDLKPDNIYVIKDPEVAGGERIKILDFGIAKVIARLTQMETPRPWAPTLQRTAIGTVLGTPAYMAPEQWRGDGSITDRADVYALGAILFEIFAGRPPFMAQVIGDLIDQHMTHPPPRLLVLAPRAPAGLEVLIQQMLGKEPLERPSMATVARQLEALLTSYFKTPEDNNMPVTTVQSPSGPINESATRPLIKFDFNFVNLKNLARQVPRLLTSHANFKVWAVRGAAGLITCAIVGIIWALQPPKPTVSATVVSPPPRTRSVRLTSSPSGAAVYVRNRLMKTHFEEEFPWILEPRCHTPCTVEIPLEQEVLEGIVTAPNFHSKPFETTKQNTTIALASLKKKGPGPRPLKPPINPHRLASRLPH